MTINNIDIENSKSLYLISTGSFGKIYLCQDSRGTFFISKEIVDKKSFFKELSVYNKIKKKVDYFPEFYNYYNGLKYSCIFLQCCQKDLSSMLKSEEKIDTYSFVLHMSEALQILKEKKIIHCDLKPENILYDKDSDLFKICDFGISCFEGDNKYFPVQTIYYRSPEVICKKIYDFSIDIWSLGCIIYQVIYNKILFEFNSEDECFFSMMILLGMPPKKLFPGVYNNNILCDNNKYYFKTNCLDECIKKDSRLKIRNNIFGNIINRCLRWNPSKRITPLEISKKLKDIEV